MKQVKLTFESENLVVDYISFNIQGLVDRKHIEKIAKYFFQILGFNSTFAKGSTGKEEDLFFDFQNQHRVSFRYYLYASEYSTYWSGTKVDFSGKNATQLYTIIKQQKFDWNIFYLSSTNLARFDYYYFRPITDAHNDDKLKYFMQSSCDKILTNYKRRKVTFGREETGYVTRIGSRTSSNYYRVYQKTKRINYDVYSEINHGLEFELELKNELVKSFQKFLFHNHIEEFEGRLVEHFYKHSKKSFVLDSCYTDWLRIGLRKIISIQKSESPLNSLVSNYLRKENLDSFFKKKQFFKLIQFLSFLRTLEYSRQFIDDQAYCVIEFAVLDFIGFTGGNMKSTYQRTKALEFFTSLQEIKPLIQKFSNEEFRRSVMFPYLKLKKQNRKWTVRMAIGEELYFYPYPFVFPGYFLTYQNKYDLEIKLQLIESFSTVGLEKRFGVKNFLNQFSVPNKDLTKIKKQLIDSFSRLKDSELIENEFSLTYKNGSSTKVKQLTPLLLTKSRDICFCETVNFRV